MDKVLETAAQMGFRIEPLVADIIKGDSTRMYVDGENVKETSYERSALSNDENQVKVNKVCNTDISPLPVASSFIKPWTLDSKLWTR